MKAFCGEPIPLFLLPIPCFASILHWLQMCEQLWRVDSAMLADTVLLTPCGPVTHCEPILRCLHL